MSMNLDAKLVETPFTLKDVFRSATADAKHISNEPETEEELRAVLKAAGELAVHVLCPAIDRLGPLTINSWYRSRVVNEAVGGITPAHGRGSQHLYGEAADVEFPAVGLKAAFIGVLESDIPFDQMILELRGASRWLHLSHKPSPAGQRRMAMLSPESGKYQPYSMARLNELLKV